MQVSIASLVLIFRVTITDNGGLTAFAQVDPVGGSGYLFINPFILDPNDLMEYLVNRVQEGFDLYYVGVFQLDERKRYAVLSLGTGEAGRKMVADGHQLSVGGSSMVGWATANRQWIENRVLCIAPGNTRCNQCVFGYDSAFRATFVGLLSKGKRQ